MARQSLEGEVINYLTGPIKAQNRLQSRCFDRFSSVYTSDANAPGGLAIYVKLNESGRRQKSSAPWCPTRGSARLFVSWAQFPQPPHKRKAERCCSSRLSRSRLQAVEKVEIQTALAGFPSRVEKFCRWTFTMSVVFHDLMRWNPKWR
jgi:hypothetical protein